ncbi:hypothetical protein D3C73_1606170 [compost metagenome]
MSGILMPSISLAKRVMTPLRPSSRIQAYAPMKGADMEEIRIRMRMTPLPLILATVMI